MKISAFQDYVFVPCVSMIIDKGVFVRTQNYLFCFRSRTESHDYRKIITTEYSFTGKAMHQAIAGIISHCSSVK